MACCGVQCAGHVRHREHIILRYLEISPKQEFKKRAKACPEEIKRERQGANRREEDLALKESLVSSSFLFLVYSRVLAVFLLSHLLVRE